MPRFKINRCNKAALHKFKIAQTHSQTQFGQLIRIYLTLVAIANAVAEKMAKQNHERKNTEC